MADYPISNVPRRIVYTGSAGVGPYAFEFEVLLNTDINVYKNDVLLTLTTDYTVTISPTLGTGEVTLVSAATGTDRITIVGARAVERTTDFTTGGDFFANTVNSELDSQTILVQQVAETAERSIKAPVTDPTNINMTLPINTSRAGKTLAFDVNGNPVPGDPIGNWRGNWSAGVSYQNRDIIKDTTNDNVYLATVAHTSSGSLPIDTNTDSAKWALVVDAEAAGTARIAAEAAQAAAETAQAAAELAETNAETAETNAETAETNAETAATNAASSASAASSSASSASSSASAASTSATNAASSASSASTSASNASSSASSASSSASTATTQATNASNSASAASTSATNASNSASAASTSATNASNSASSASTSATNAAASEAAALAALESFNETYLGAKSSDPTLDNNGDPVSAGDWYFNTTSNRSRIYDGAAWNFVALEAGAFLASGNNLSDLANAATARDNLGVEIGADVQAYSPQLATYASTGVGMRNRIINGAMMIDQRNAGVSVTPTDPSYTLDRWKFRVSQTSKLTCQRNAGSVTLPTGYTNYLGVTSSSAYSVISTDYFVLVQDIEGFNTSDLGFGTSSASTITLSFQVYSSLTGTFSGALRNSEANRSYPFTYTVSSANTWTTISITISGDTTGTWIGATNGIGLSVIFNLGCGSTYNSTAGSWQAGNYTAVTGSVSVVGTSGATFYITGVQLEKGSTATSFDYRPYGTELALCQRYYYQQTSGTYSVSSTTNGSSVVVTIPFPVTMRASPTATNPFTNALYDNAGPAAGKWSFNQPFIANMTKTGTVSVGATAQNVDNMQLPFYGATFSAQPTSINNNGLTVTASAEL